MVLVSLFQQGRSSSLAGENEGKIHATLKKLGLRGEGEVRDIKKTWMFDQKQPRLCILRGVTKTRCEPAPHPPARLHH